MIRGICNGLKIINSYTLSDKILVCPIDEYENRIIMALDQTSEVFKYSNRFYNYCHKSIPLPFSVVDCS